MFKEIVFLIVILLPIGWILRDWLFSDKLTKGYCQTTKILLALWVVFGVLSTVYYWEQNQENQQLKNNVNELINGKNELLKKTSSLATQIDKYQQDIKTKDKRITELETQANVLRSVDGNIEFTITANWKKDNHPGNQTPLAWDDASSYVFILDNSQKNSSKLKFLVQSIKLKKISKRDLKIKLEIKARPDGDAVGKQLDVLSDFDLLIVYVPYVYRNKTVDGIINLKNLSVMLIVNRDKRVNIEFSDNYLIDYPHDGEMPRIALLSKKSLFNDVLVE